jgi:hypothetical protein
MPEERKQQRLEAWVDRELRALLQTDDIAIVRAYVMGLVRGIGFPACQVCLDVCVLLRLLYIVSCLLKSPGILPLL